MRAGDGIERSKITSAATADIRMPVLVLSRRQRQPDRERTECRAQEPTLHAQPARPLREPARQRAGDGDERAVDQRRYRDMHDSQGQALQQHRTAGRVDELRKQRQVEHGDLRIDHRRGQRLAEQHAVGHRVEWLRSEAEASAAQRVPGEPQQIGRCAASLIASNAAGTASSSADSPIAAASR